MRYSDFADQVMLGLYRFAERGQADVVPFQRIVDHYQIKYRPGWLVEAQRDLQDQGLIGGPSNSRNDEMAAGKIAGAGLRHVERLLEDENFSNMALAFEIIDDSYEAPQSEREAPLPIDQRLLEEIDWASVSARIEPATLAEIKDMTAQLVATIQQADMEERARANALKHAEAIASLLEAPDPPWKVIVELLNNPVLGAMLNVIAIFELIAVFF